MRVYLEERVVEGIAPQGSNGNGAQAAASSGERSTSNIKTVYLLVATLYEHQEDEEGREEIRGHEVYESILEANEEARRQLLYELSGKERPDSDDEDGEDEEGQGIQELIEENEGSGTRCYKGTAVLRWDDRDSVSIEVRPMEVIPASEPGLEPEPVKAKREVSSGRPAKQPRTYR